MGATQNDLAHAGAVSRPTQAHYEAERTAPDTDYLAKVQKIGIDVPFLLFSKSENEIATESQSNQVNWALMQRAWDDVEFFCLRVAPSCPVSYRWRMVAQLYEALIRRGTDALQSTGIPIKIESEPLIDAIWNSYEKR